MLKVLLTKKNDDFFEFMANTVHDHVIVVTPNPQAADLVRKSFDSLGKTVESITISKFIKNELNFLSDDEVIENYKGKAELVLLLGAIWKKIGKGSDYLSFKRAFNLLTEFRSFSMSAQVLETVLEHYDSNLGEGVLWLHRFLDEMGIVDEHKSYFLLAERLREGDLPPDYSFDKNLVFYGFDFMTASQVDMIKSFALRDNVYIPMYKDSYEKTQMLDWIRWFDGHNTETTDISSNEIELKEIPLKRFPKGYFSKALNSVQEKDFSIVLGTKTLTRENIQELPIENLVMKLPVDLFSFEHKNIFDLLEQKIKTIEEMSTFDLREELNDLTRNYIEHEKYRELKTVFTILNTLNEWEELSSDNTSVGEFDLKILFESSVLDLPRINLTTLSSNQNTSQVKSIKNIDEYKEEKIIFGIHSAHGSIKGVGANFSENVEKYLASIGPIRRAEFEMNILKCRLEEFISENDVEIFMEEGILEHDTNWSKVLSGIQLNPVELGIKTDYKKEYTELKVEEQALKKISASRLQKYLECPRKYYFQFINNLSPQIEFGNELSVLELGQIEHKVIEEYFHKTTKVDEALFEEIILNTLENYTSKKVISPKLHEEYLVEVRAFTWDVINTLSQLVIDLGFSPTFEFPFNITLNEIKYSGSIDCLLTSKTGNQKIIIDFKRSNFVFSTFTSISNYEQVQLWFYLQRLNELETISVDDSLLIGYIDLSNRGNSMFFGNDKDFIANIKASTQYSKFKLIDELSETLEDYKQFEDELILKLKNDKEFNPIPMNSKSCGFCSLKNTCPRHSSEEESNGNS
jgi:hypothetical protein